jgi:tRNA A-37 threonylcarbamoyl transferase component Bud32
MSRTDTDRDLLLGLLALRSGLVDRQTLAQALAEWRRDPGRSLEQHLAARGVTSDDLAALVDLRRRALARHENQATVTLNALDATDPFLNDLRREGGFDPSSVVDPTFPDMPAALPDGERYEVVKFHARGGLGEVYLAHDQALDRDVALKQIRPDQADNPTHRADFLREAHLTGLLEHPGVVPIYGLGTHPDGRPFYAMRFIEGENLRAAVTRYHSPGQSDSQRRVALRELLRRFIEVCNTLAFAHARGIIHRDLKPDNIMLGKYGETLVVDWGLARFVTQKEGEEQKGRSGVVGTETVAGQVKGTPAYMAPEQAAGQKDLGPACDIYGLGATLFYLLTGQPPVQGSIVEVMIIQVQRGTLRRPREVKADVPAGLEAVCLKALALKPEARYATAQALAEDLARWLADEPPLAYREPVGERLGRLMRRYRSATVASAAALFVITVASLVALYFVNSAWRSEARTNAIDAVRRDVRDAVWDEEHLARIDANLARLKGLDAAEADRIRGEAILASLDGPPREPILNNWAPDQIRALRDPALVERCQQRLTERRLQLRTVFVLEHPFANLGDVFDASRVQISGTALLPSAVEPKPEGPILVRTRVTGLGNVELAATFDGTWSRVPILGLALQAGPSGGYQFLLSSFEYSARAARDLDRFDPLETALKARERVYVSISREGVVLAQTQMLLPAGELKLLAQRQGDRLRFVVNEQTLEFEDLFAPVPPADAPFALVWSGSVRLTRLEGRREGAPRSPSPMEAGDRLFATQQFEKALGVYEQYAQETGDPVATAHARLKMALCLYERGRKKEATETLEKLDATLAALKIPEEARARKVAEVKTLALARRWLWALRDGSEDPDKLDEQLPKTLNVAQLVTLIPAEQRKEAIDAIRLRGPRWRVIFETEAQLPRLLRAIRVEELLNESDFERRQTLWRLVDLKRVLGDKVTARNLLVAQLKEAMPPDERVTYLRDLIWILLERKEVPVAHAEIEKALRENTAPEFLPLHLERARLFVDEKKFSLAEKEVDAYLSKVPAGEGTYADYADACLLKGFLREEQGEAGAQEAWKRGLVRNWPGTFPLPPRGRFPSAIVENQLANAGGFHVLLAGLTGQWSDREMEPILLGMVLGSGLKSKSLDVILRQNLSPELIRRATLALCADPEGKEIARRLVYRQTDLRGFSRDLLLRAALCVFREGSIRGRLLPDQVGPQPLDPERDDRTAVAIALLGDAFLAGRVDAETTAELFQLWQPKQPPAETWDSVAPKLTPELRLSAAFLFAQRLLFLQRPADARILLKELADSTHPQFAGERAYAERELRKLPP